jgi:hypothetical protein
MFKNFFVFMLAISLSFPAVSAEKKSACSAAETEKILKATYQMLGSHITISGKTHKLLKQGKSEKWTLEKFDRERIKMIVAENEKSRPALEELSRITENNPSCDPDEFMKLLNNKK